MLLYKRKFLLMEKLYKIILDYYYLILLPFLSISVFYAMEYLTRGIEFFTSETGIRWKYLILTATIQFFVSAVITWSVMAIFQSGNMEEYKSFSMVATILLGATPFNISVLVWVAIKLELYRFMRIRYGKDFKEEELLDKKTLEKRQEQREQKEKEKQEKQQREKEKQEKQEKRAINE